ncbi:MAG: RnfABCDGE type electron transport complex subunit D [Firmicutes bacterium]|nr:RnfABCDGE type electron transport complex subunit D [Bacillota bacterium]
MESRYHEKLVVSSAPHQVSTINTTKVMGTVILALAPATIVGFVQFGIRAVILTAVCIIASVVFEYLYNMINKRTQTVGDLSAVLTGLLIALNCPARLPLWIAVIGCFAAIIVVKQLFGGLGQNLFNPAVTARIFMFIAFASEMTTWPVAHFSKLMNEEGVDVTSRATALGELSHGVPLEEVLQNYSNMDLFLGNCGGCIGEVSALALLIGGIFLIARKIITWHIPVAFLGTVAVLGLIWGACQGDVIGGCLFQLFAGGVMLGAFFCATDYVTSPTTAAGKIIFGIGCGLFTMLIRLFASYPEGVSFAILLMNILTPYIDRVVEGRMFPAPKEGGDN